MQNQKFDEDKFRIILESIEDVYYESNADGVILDISPSVEKVLKFTREELIGTSVGDLYVNKRQWEELLGIINECKMVSDFEILLREKNDLEIYCSLNTVLIRGSEEKSSRLVGAIRDITKRKKAEKKLWESENLYRTLAEKSFAGVYVIQDGIFRYVNSTAASYAGYEASELIGMHSFDLVYSEDRKLVATSVSEMLKGNRTAPYEYRVVTKDRQLRWILETVTPVTWDGKPAILGNSMDTSWTMSRMDLGIVQAVIDSVHDGVYIADKNGYYVTANEGFEQISGITRSEMVGKHTTYLLAREKVAEVVNLEVLKDQQSRTKLIKYPSGKSILVSAAIVWDRNKLPIGVVSSLRDLTALNEMQEKLTRSNALITRYRKKIEVLEDKLSNGNSQLIARSKETLHLLSVAEKIADSDVTVLIRGESGVGKEVIARYIHDHSDRKAFGAFVKIDCAALPANLLESELFGYERGSFTDARKEGKQGLFEMADKGTLFLDEIGELPYELQSKLLSAIQDKEIKRVGGLVSHLIDVRIIAATNRDLEEMVRERKFRQDLYYRLSVIPIFISPLRDRPEDILPLISHYIASFNKQYKTNKYMTKEVLNHLSAYNWPGNVRELKNSIERLILMSPLDEIKTEDIADEMKIFHKINLSTLNLQTSETNKVGSLKINMEAFEKVLITNALNIHKNLADAAKYLEVDLSTLTRKKQKYRLNKKFE